MRQMILFCVFSNVRYLRLLNLGMESLVKFGNVSREDTDIVVYTSTPFHDLIRAQSWYDRVTVVINDTKETIPAACRARLDVFDLAPTAACEKILYIDADVLILGDLNPVFDVLQKDILYAVEEGYLHHNYWGGRLFGNDIKKYTPDQKGFNSGILLFRNSPTMRRLFDDIRVDITRRPYDLGMHDQPYFNYHAFQNGLCDIEKMRAFVELHLVTQRRRRPSCTLTFVHFIDGKYSHFSKEAAMRRAWQSYVHSFHGDRLGKIPREIDTESFQKGETDG